MMKRLFFGGFFLLSVLEDLVSLHRASNFSFFSICVCDIDVDYNDVWSALEMNQGHSIVFEVAHKYCTSDSSLEYEGYSIF